MPRLLVLVSLLAACAHGAPQPNASPSSAPSAASDKGTTTTRRQDTGGSIAAWTPVQGPPDAVITIVEFGDFQCPYCARVQGTLKALREQYGNRLRIAFRQLPLPFHPFAQRAAEASMAAHAQGKFWAMHDQLYGAAEFNDDTIANAARAAGLDMARFDRDVKDPRYAKQVADDLAHAKEAGASGTPAFFINGRSLSGAQPIEAFKETIDAELIVADALVAAGAPRARLYDIRLASATNEEAQPKPKIDHHDDEERKAARRATLAAWTPVRGPKLAKVTIVEYSDFECPFCARAAKTIDELRKRYGNDLRIAYRHNPLPFHPHARAYSELSMAAQEQGKFWASHDYLFAHSDELRDLPDAERVEKVARAIGLDMSRYQQSMSAHAHATELDADIAEAAHLGARGTPTFYVNGQPVIGAQPIDAFIEVIDAEKKKAQALLDKGVAPADLYEKTLAAIPEK